MSKTPDYVKKSVDKYREGKEFVTLTLPKGTKERLKAFGVGQREVAGFAKDLLLKKLNTMENMPLEPPKQTHTATKTEQTENVPPATEKRQETEKVSGLTPIDEVLNKIIAEHIETGGDK